LDELFPFLGLVYATVSGKIFGFDLRSDKTVFCMKIPSSHGLITSLLLEPAWRWLLISTVHGVYSVWDLRFHLPVLSWLDSKHPAAMQMACFTDPDRRSQVVSVNGGSDITLWDVAQGKLVSSMITTPVIKEPLHFPLNPPRMTPDYKLHDTTSYIDKGIVTRDGCVNAAFDIRAVCTVPGYVVSGSADALIRIWDLARPASSFVFGSTHRQMTYKEDGTSVRESLVTDTRSSSSTPSRGYTSSVTNHTDAITQLCITTSVDSYSSLISGSRDGVVKIWK
jgi:WD40 repeat protein